MNEARIILPMMGNNGEDLSDAHSKLADSLVHNFGGYTSHNGVGGWQSPEGGRFVEKVVIYDVAMQPTLENQYRMRQIGMWICGKAHQQCVYVRQPTGHAELVFRELPAPVVDAKAEPAAAIAA